jgi:hypothetical protein
MKRNALNNPENLENLFLSLEISRDCNPFLSSSQVSNILELIGQLSIGGDHSFGNHWADLLPFMFFKRLKSNFKVLKLYKK